MPCPTSLVVKNGSKARSSDLPRHADAGVGDADHDILAGRHLGLPGRVALVEMGVGGLDRELAAVRHGVARIDREVEHRDLQLVGIDMHAPQPARQHRLDRDLLAERAPQQVGHAGDQPVDVEDLGIERLLA